MNAAARHRRPKSVRRVRLIGLLIAATVVTLAWDRVFVIGSSPSGAASNPSPSKRGGQALSEAFLPPVTGPTPTITSAPVKVRAAGSGIFASANGRSIVLGTGLLVPYRVEAENGLPVSAASFAKAVDETLGDERGWTSQDTRSSAHREPTSESSSRRRTPPIAFAVLSGRAGRCRVATGTTW